MVSAKVKVAVTGVSGAATGVAVSTLAAEWVSRSTGQVGWNAAGVKAVIKSALGLVFYLVSGRVGEAAAMFCEIFAYTTVGSIILDVALAAYPGGIPGLAEDWAITARTMAAGGSKVASQLSQLERRSAPTQTVKPSIL